MRPGKANEIGPPGEEDLVHLLGLGDNAHRHRRQPRLVADPVGDGAQGVLPPEEQDVIDLNEAFAAQVLACPLAWGRAGDRPW